MSLPRKLISGLPNLLTNNDKYVIIYVIACMYFVHIHLYAVQHVLWKPNFVC